MSVAVVAMAPTWMTPTAIRGGSRSAQDPSLAPSGRLTEHATLPQTCPEFKSGGFGGACNNPFPTPPSGSSKALALQELPQTDLAHQSRKLGPNMSRAEIREELEEAILRCRRTARQTMVLPLTAAEQENATRADDEALGDVWRLLQELG